MQMIQLCILSGQTLPNLLPAILLRPDRLLVAASTAMKDKAHPLAEVLLNKGIITHISDVIELPNMPDSDYQAMVSWADSHIAQIRQLFPQAHIQLNITGGTKLMSQALMNSLVSDTGPHSVIYCDTANRALEFLYPQPQRQTLPTNILDIDSILTAQDFIRESAASDESHWQTTAIARAELTQLLATKAEAELGSLISSLNGAIQQVKPITAFPVVIPFHREITAQAWKNAFEKLTEHGILKLLAATEETPYQHIVIPNESTLNYIHGGWLEEHVWLCAREAGIEDSYCSLNIRSNHNDPEISKWNEVDVAISINNRMLIIECKTGKIDRSEVYNPIFDKLESLAKRSGGLLSESWLVTARMPDDEEIYERIQSIAKARNIKLIEPHQLKKLTQLFNSMKE